LIGSLTPEKSWWDLLSYHITIKPDYKTKFITENNKIRYKVISEQPSELMQIDLVKPLIIDSVTQNGKKLSFQNKGNIWYVSGISPILVAGCHKVCISIIFAEMPTLSTLKEIEGKLPEEHFIRVQKSFIIALNKFTALDGNRVILKDVSSEILIGETYKQQFLEAIKKKQIL